MNKNAFISIVIAVLTPLLSAENAIDPAERMADSMVYIESSRVGWEQLQPWRQTGVATVGAYGTAVGPTAVLTTAAPLSNAVSVRVRRHDQNEYIPAEIRVIDYEANLCLLELDETAVQTPLKPVVFSDKFIRNRELTAFRLGSDGDITQARATLDRAEVRFSTVSFARQLQYVLTSPSRSTGAGELYCLDDVPVGIACWSSDSEVGLIPAETINRFLTAAAGTPYRGFGAIGFETTPLLDPAVRKYLQLPEDQRDGIYVTSVYTMGTGHLDLLAGDVILSIDGHRLNAHGRYEDQRYDRLGFEHLIARVPVGQTLEFVIWRNEKEESVDVEVLDIDAGKMLVPYYIYDRRPQYLVTGGFVFQVLTRDYMTLWGDGWQGKVPPHLFQYFRDRAFGPTDQRSDIVLLSYVLPTEANLGYHQLGRLVVSSVNGTDIGSFQHLYDALNDRSDRPFHVVEFELDSPTVVIPKAQLDAIDQQVMSLYGISEPSYIH